MMLGLEPALTPAQPPAPGLGEPQPYPGINLWSFWTLSLSPNTSAGLFIWTC